MKRLFAILLLLLPVSCLAQSTSVTLQVTDAGSQSWNSGTWSATLTAQAGSGFSKPFNLVGGGAVPNQSQSGTLSATGGATMTLTPNASIAPVVTVWNFVACPQGSGVCYTLAVTISGASQTVTLTPPAISVNCGPNTSAYADAEVACGAIGGTYYNLTNQAGRVCQAVSGNTCTLWAAAVGSSATVAPNNKDIYVSPNCGSQTNCSPVKGDVKVSYTMTTTNGSATVSCSGSDATCSLSSAVDVGKQILITTAANSGGSQMVSGDVAFTAKTTKTTISSVTNTTTVVMSQTANANLVGIGVGAWGTNDGAALATAYSLLVASARGTCGTLELPNAIMFVDRAEFINGPNSCFSAVGLNREGLLIKGVGISSTWLIPTNDFNFASCTGPNGTGTGNSTSCFGDNGAATFGGGTILQDFSIVGLGQSLTGTTHSVSVLGIESNSFIFNVNCLGWGAAASGMNGLQLAGNGTSNVYSAAYNLQLDGCGSTGLNLNGSGPFMLSSGSYIGDNKVSAVACGGSNSYLLSSGNGYGPIFPSAGSAIMNMTNCRLLSVNDTFGFGGCNSVAGTANVYVAGGAGVAQIDNATITTGCTSAVWADVASGIIHLRGSLVTGGTNSVKTSAGASVFDDGGNTFTGAVANAGNFFGATNSAAGTACGTGNFALTSGWGTSSVTSVAANGNILGCHVTITGAAGAAGPVLTWTYPAAPPIAPASCHLIGTTASLTGVQVGTPGATTVAFTFVGTPAAVTYQFDVGCP